MIFKHFFFLCDLGKHFDRQITVSVLSNTPLIMKSPPKLCNSKNPRGPLLGYNSPPRYLLILLLYVSYWLTRETTCGFVEATRGIDKDKVWSCHLSTRQELLLQDRQRQKQLKEIIYPLWLLCFFSHNLSKKNSPPPNKPLYKLRVVSELSVRLFSPSLCSVRYFPPPPPPKKKLSFCKCGLDAIGKMLFFRATKGERKKAKKKQTS